MVKSSTTQAKVNDNAFMGSSKEASLEQNQVQPTLWDEFKSLFYVILIAVCIRIFIFEPFHIPSGSMRKTLVEGDYVFSTKYSYGYSRHSFIFSTNLFSGRFLESLPDRGDVVIFRPPHNMNERYIKRLIGFPGEKIEIKGGVVFINDVAIKRNFIQTYEEKGLSFDEFREISPGGKEYQVRYLNKQNVPSSLAVQQKIANNIGPFFVPEGSYFFLGDNRDQSGDSRFELGSVPIENFISKAQFVFFSFDEPLFLEDSLSLDQVVQIWRWITSFRLGRFFYVF